MDKNCNKPSKLSLGSVLTDVETNRHKINTCRFLSNIFTYLRSTIILLAAGVEFKFLCKQTFDYVFMKRRHARYSQSIICSLLYKDV